jgi:acetolactate synthase I/II/III large subunit
MKLSDYVVEFLISNNIGHVFEVCGGAITHLLDSLHDRKDISVVSMHHEQAAGFAAEGYARIGGGMGAAMATSGPGATNLITGIASCFFDSIPCLFITGQVNTYEFKFEKPVRQIGFQETDIVSIVKPIVKEAILVTEPDKIKYYLEKAVYIAKSGRPGPVLIDIPMNIQRAEINPGSLVSFQENTLECSESLDGNKIKDIVKLIKNSVRPVVLAGGGIRSAKGSEELLKFVKKTEIPVVVSLMGLDSFPHDNESFTGMIGTYGNRYANLSVANSDLLLILGSRLDTRQTGTLPETFARNAKIVHVDIDPHELNNKIKAHFSVNCDIKKFLSELNNSFDEYDKDRIREWKEAVKKYKKKYPAHPACLKENIEPASFMDKLSDFIPDDAVISVDVGQNQIWSAQFLKINKTQRFITQGGAGAIGSSLSMAIGACFANPGKITVVITGDGGFQLNIQELQTIYHYNLPVKIILLNNNCYGMIRQFQEQYFNSIYQSSVIGYSCPDFQKVVSSYGIPAQKCACIKDVSGELKKLFTGMGPMFLEVVLEADNKVIPKLSVNKPIEDQEPFLSRAELESNMFIDLLPKEDAKEKNKNP